MLRWATLSTNAHQVTATWTATALDSLVLTADATTVIAKDVNAIDINPAGEIRYSICGDPSTTKGMVLPWWSHKTFRGIHPRQLKLIATSGTILVNIQLWYTSWD